MCVAFEYRLVNAAKYTVTFKIFSWWKTAEIWEPGRRDHTEINHASTQGCSKKRCTSSSGSSSLASSAFAGRSRSRRFKVISFEPGEVAYFRELIRLFSGLPQKVHARAVLTSLIFDKRKIIRRLCVTFTVSRNR